jgi:CBS domain-containing protein
VKTLGLRKGALAMRVEEFMTTRLELVDADQSVYDALEKMVDLRIRSLLVRFGGRNLDYGVITARDVVFKVLARGMNPREAKVSDIASRPIICIKRDTTVHEATQVMQESNIARVFVCDGEKIVGVVALLDVMTASLIMRARGEHDS